MKKILSKCDIKILLFSAYDILLTSTHCEFNVSQEKMLTDNDIPLRMSVWSSPLLLAAISSWRKEN